MTELKLPQAWPKTASWLRITEGGDLELELYDYSGESMGGDVAWTWRVPAFELPRLLSVLPPTNNLLETLSKAQPNIRALRDWLRETGIELEEQFESQA